VPKAKDLLDDPREEGVVPDARDLSWGFWFWKNLWL